MVAIGFKVICPEIKQSLNQEFLSKQAQHLTGPRRGDGKCCVESFYNRRSVLLAEKKMHSKDTYLEGELCPLIHFNELFASCLIEHEDLLEAGQ